MDTYVSHQNVTQLHKPLAYPSPGHRLLVMSLINERSSKGLSHTLGYACRYIPAGVLSIIHFLSIKYMCNVIGYTGAV